MLDIQRGLSVQKIGRGGCKCFSCGRPGDILDRMDNIMSHNENSLVVYFSAGSNDIGKQWSENENNGRNSNCVGYFAKMMLAMNSRLRQLASTAEKTFIASRLSSTE